MFFFPFCFPFLLLEADLKKIDDVKSQLVGFFYNLCVCEGNGRKKVTNLRPKLMKISSSCRLLVRICASELRFTFLMCIVLVRFFASADWITFSSWKAKANLSNFSFSIWNLLLPFLLIVWNEFKMRQTHIEEAAANSVHL